MISTLFAANVYLSAVLFPIIIGLIVLSVHMLLNAGRNEVIVPQVVFEQQQQTSTPVWVQRHVEMQRYAGSGYSSVEQTQRDRVARERMNSYLNR